MKGKKNPTCMCLLRSLTDPPAPNETISVNVSLVSLPGNAVDVRPYIYDYNEGIQNFTLADYGKQFDTIIKTRGKCFSHS
jgi:hypothetical protein